jgi:hypothetical protein
MFTSLSTTNTDTVISKKLSFDTDTFRHLLQRFFSTFIPGPSRLALKTHPGLHLSNFPIYCCISQEGHPPTRVGLAPRKASVCKTLHRCGGTYEICVNVAAVTVDV